MDSLNDAMAILMRNCQASTTLMLTKELESSPAALGAILTFDEIADHPAESLLDPKERERIVALQLRKALSFAANARTPS
ncbi:hypothetical protein ACYPKM_02755 [Pseudomonas aeruginosa]